MWKSLVLTSNFTSQISQKNWVGLAKLIGKVWLANRLMASQIPLYRGLLQQFFLSFFLSSPWHFALSLNCSGCSERQTARSPLGISSSFIYVVGGRGRGRPSVVGQFYLSRAKLLNHKKGGAMTSAPGINSSIQGQTQTIQ